MHYSRNSNKEPVVPGAGGSEAELYWLALLLVPGLGSRSSVALIRTYQSPEAVFQASRAELESTGLRGSVAQSIASGCTFDDAADQQRRMRDAGAALIHFRDARFPARLREIYDPPLLLFAKGNPGLLDQVMLGVVGTRRPTPYGMAVADRFGAELAMAGLTVASGMARGIDTAAHRASLRVGGDTVAVFGCGVDVIYPAENRKLAEEIGQKGLIVSEYPMGTPGHPQNFPTRNRIISGMSFGVMVVEGAQYSGSAITARLAMEQGREVFAIPGNITSKTSWGTNLLIKEGAKLVQTPEDILTELGPEDRRKVNNHKGFQEDESSAAGGPSYQGESGPGLVQLLGPSAPVGSGILESLQVEQATQIDVIMEKVPNCSSSEVIAVLFQLELAGLVRQLPGKNFVRVW